jgi:hypothetical protein
VQNEAAAAVDRAAIAHDEVARRGGRRIACCSVEHAELHEQVGKPILLDLIDDQPHRALVAVGADVDHGTRETGRPSCRAWR